MANPNLFPVATSTFSSPTEPRQNLRNHPNPPAMAAPSISRNPHGIYRVMTNPYLPPHPPPAPGTHGGNIWVSSLSVFCFSISSSSVRSRMRSSRLLEYCSSMRSMESMMLVFRPLLMLLNCQENPL